MVANKPLEVFLTTSGVIWEIIPRKRQMQICSEWQLLYGSCFHRHSPQPKSFRATRIAYHLPIKEGGKAIEQYSRQSVHSFMLVPFLGDTGGPHAIGKRTPPALAYQCQTVSAPPNLSAFAGIDFFIVPPDMSWTMVHTHEDYELGGPYFIRKEWLVPQIRDPKW